MRLIGVPKPGSGNLLAWICGGAGKTTSGSTRTLSGYIKFHTSSCQHGIGELLLEGS